MFQLACRMGIQLGADLADQCLQVSGTKLVAHGIGNPLVVLGLEHAALREGELKHGVSRYLLPVDQLVNDVLVDPERQDAGDHLHFKALFCAQLL